MESKVLRLLSHLLLLNLTWRCWSGSGSLVKRKAIKKTHAAYDKRKAISEASEVVVFLLKGVQVHPTFFLPKPIHGRSSELLLLGRDQNRSVGAIQGHWRLFNISTKWYSRRCFSDKTRLQITYYYWLLITWKKAELRSTLFLVGIGDRVGNYRGNMDKFGIFYCFIAVDILRFVFCSVFTLREIVQARKKRNLYERGSASLKNGSGSEFWCFLSKEFRDMELWKTVQVRARAFGSAS